MHSDCEGRVQGLKTMQVKVADEGAKSRPTTATIRTPTSSRSPARPVTPGRSTATPPTAVGGDERVLPVGGLLQGDQPTGIAGRRADPADPQPDGPIAWRLRPGRSVRRHERARGLPPSWRTVACQMSSGDSGIAVSSISVKRRCGLPLDQLAGSRLLPVQTRLPGPVEVRPQDRRVSSSRRT
jgi:hypothetical protein